MQTAIIWTASACQGNPGAGGYATAISVGSEEPVHLHNGRRWTTSERMEFFAAIRALTALEEPHSIEIRTTNETLVNTINRQSPEVPTRPGRTPPAPASKAQHHRDPPEETDRPRTPSDLRLRTKGFPEPPRQTGHRLRERPTTGGPRSRRHPAATRRRTLMTDTERDPNNASERITAAARALTRAATTHYWQELIPNRPIRPVPPEILFVELTPKEQKLAVSTGHEAANLDTPAANSAISSLYTKFMAHLTRTELAAYYTPHNLSAKLASLLNHTDIDWRSVTVLDAACGAGSLMLPIIRLMTNHPPTAVTGPADILRDIGSRLRGFDIDPFAVWLGQVFLDIEMSRIPGVHATDLPTLLYVRNTLESDPQAEQYNLVLANPPYQKVRPDPVVHEKFKRSLSGHANMCTLFIDQALRLTRPGGTTALITPTSILTGQTFQALRKTLAQEAFPIAMDFITTRQDIFENVLQEIVLSVHRKRPIQPTARVLSSSPLLGGFATAPIGSFTLPLRPEQPWLIPRLPGHETVAQQAMKMPHRLPDYGYQIHTGPLVWNHHSNHLRQHYGRECKTRHLVPVHPPSRRVQVPIGPPQPSPLHLDHRPHLQTTPHHRPLHTRKKDDGARTGQAPRGRRPS